MLFEMAAQRSRKIPKQTSVVISSGKEDMLARMRTALGRRASSVGAAALPPFVGCSSVPAQEGLVARFRREVELVGGFVEHVGSPEGIRQYLQSLLSTKGCSIVALSDGFALRDLRLFECLAEQDLEIIPTLIEFVTGEPEGIEGRRDRELQNRHDELRGEQYRSLLLRAQVGITSADYAIAETGSLVLVSGGEQHRLISLLPPIHLCLLDPAQIVPSLASILPLLHDNVFDAETFPRAVTLITGPSCTADIEQTLTIGMHGPRELHVLLYEPTSAPVFS